MYQPREHDEEAGVVVGADDIPDSLIEEPLEGENVARKDIEVSDGASSSSRIIVQRLGSIPSFGREIPVVRIVASEPEAGASSFCTRDLESQVEQPSELDVQPETIQRDERQEEPKADPVASPCNSGIREESTLPAQAQGGGRANNFKRPEIALPTSPQVNPMESSSSRKEGEESEDESEGEEAAEQEVTKLMNSPLAGALLSKTKARLQEPPPITPAVKDQITDSLLKRAASIPTEGAGNEAAQAQGGGTPGSFKQPATPLEKQPSIPPHVEEEDPLEDTIIPEYKEKLKRDESLFWIVLQWVCFVLLVTLLICSVNIKSVRDITWLGNNIWRWQAVALVIFSGRLIAGWVVQAFVLLIEKRFLLRKRVLYFVYGLRKSVKNCIWLALVITIWETVFTERDAEALRVITRLLWCAFTISMSWMFKILAVKVAANGFHRSAYFERIQECLFNQYLLATLSAPPSMQIAADPSGGEELITSRYNPHGSPNRVRNQLSKIPSGQEVGLGTSPRLAPIIARSAVPIEQDKLQQLTSENVSAWTLKSLMKLIRKKNLASYSASFSNNEEWEIDSEVRAKAAAKQIFYNIARPGRKFLMLRDFLYFLPEDKASRAFALFETTESGTITKKAFVKWVVNVYKERRALALTLNDNKTVVAKLHKVLDAVHIYC